MDIAWDTSSSSSKWTSAMVKCLLAKAKDSTEFIKLTDGEIDDDEDEEDEFEDEEPEPEVSGHCNNNQLEDVQGSLVTHEVINPLMESLATIEVPYRCLYMSCVNFYSSKGQMLHHLKIEHGLQMHLVPVVVNGTLSPSNQTVNGGSLINSFCQVKPSSTSTVTTNGEEERSVVLGQRSQVADHHPHHPHHSPHTPSAAHGHVRHRCPYAQCFTCPHCFGCYSTRYRLNLHLKCSHREQQQVHQAAAVATTTAVASMTNANAFQVESSSQVGPQTQEVRTSSSSTSPSSSSSSSPSSLCSSSSHQSLVNLVKCNNAYVKSKRLPVK